MIDREELLSSFVRDLDQAEWVAVDTEPDSLHAYPEKLCLMQLSIPSDDVLVDPLAGMEMGEFFSSLSAKTLIMHGADYDVRLLKMGCGFGPESIFDTMLAARLLGRRQFGLSHLTKEILGVELEKTSQKANWAKRPLTDKMSEYALNDTKHLQPLAKVLKTELEATGRIEWHSQECDRLIRDNSNINTHDPDKVWRIKGSVRLTSQALGVLRELWLWREKEAKRRNRPPYFVLSPDIMIKISDASAQGVEIEQWVPRRVPEHRRREIRKCIKHAIKHRIKLYKYPNKPMDYNVQIVPMLAVDNENSPLSKESINLIGSTNLSVSEKHHLRMLLHCLECFKSMSKGNNEGLIPGKEVWLEWCLKNPVMF